MKVRFDQVEQIGEEITRQTLESLASFVETDRKPLITDRQSSIPLDHSALVVFNPTSFPAPMSLPPAIELPPNVSEFDLLDENGISLPYQERGLGSHEIINMDFRSCVACSLPFGNIK